MALISAQDAAILAQAVYNVMPATSRAEALQLAQRTPALNSSSGTSPSLSVAVTPQSGLLGSSGAYVRRQTGFGLICDRRGPEGNEMVVIMRGTQSGFDWASNLNVGLDVGPHGALVHSGFNRVYNSFREDLASAISAQRPAVVHFVGHSLGGALASLAALDFIGGGQVSGYLYTFGAPRVGSLGTSTVLEGRMSSAQVRRVYALSDPVPMIPLLPFRHYGPGSIGLQDSFQSICVDAHLMNTSYLPSMPQSGWPTMVALPNRSDPAYWLARAAESGSLSRGIAYFCLSQALAAIMAALNGLNLVLSPGITVLDRITDALAKGAMLAAKIGEQVLSFVRTALRVIGRVSIAATVTAADLTVSFLRWVLDLLLAPVIAAASRAGRMLS